MSATWDLGLLNTRLSRCASSVNDSPTARMIRGIDKSSPPLLLKSAEEVPVASSRDSPITILGAASRFLKAAPSFDIESAEAGHGDASSASIRMVGAPLDSR